MTKAVEVPYVGVLTRVTTASNSVERAELQREAMELVEDDRFGRPVPRFLTELPFGGDADETTDRLASALLVAEDPDDAQNTEGTLSGKSLIGKPITVWDLRVAKGDKPGGWGAYLLLDVTIEDSAEHLVVNTGAKQLVARLARCWAEGQFPVTGAIAAIPNTGGQGDPALKFIVAGSF